MADLLIIVDAQYDFIDGVLGSEYAQEIVPRIIHKIECHRGEVVLTQDTHTYNYLHTQEGVKLPVPHCKLHTIGWELHEGIWVATEKHITHVIRKSTFGVDDNGLGVIARTRHDKIHIIGYVTDICVITNAIIIKNAFPEIPVIVDSSCCAGTSKEAHEAALMVARSCQIEVT